MRETSLTASLLSTFSLFGPNIRSRVSLYLASLSSRVIADLSLATFESVGDATPVPRWLSSPVSEPALEGTIEPSAVFVPDSTLWPSLPKPARRMIVMVGCEEDWTSEGSGGFGARALNGGGLENVSR